MISAMSYGALGAPAVQALGRGARMSGIPMNTGEGGYPKYHLMTGADLIFQMGTAKFGVRDADGRLDDDRVSDLAAKPEIKMIEIKFSQGAKPGKGGLLPKEKITKEIAELRGVPLGQDVISPPYHAECRTPGATVAFIRRVQEVSGLPVGIKFCVGKLDEVRVLLEEMKAQSIFPDYISVDGGEGGTGAAPKPYLDGFGVPLLPALCVVQRLLVEIGIRDRLKLFSAGKLINAAKWVQALSLGADAIYTARGFMLALGCIQALQCGSNTCPVGITTHDPELQHGLVIEDKAQRVKNYVEGVYHDFEELLLSIGVKSAQELSLENLYIPPASIIAAEAGA
jgi:glutamate synthase domain-containing protein 2